MFQSFTVSTLKALDLALSVEGVTEKFWKLKSEFWAFLKAIYFNEENIKIKN